MKIKNVNKIEISLELTDKIQKIKNKNKECQIKTEQEENQESSNPVRQVSILKNN